MTEQDPATGGAGPPAGDRSTGEELRSLRLPHQRFGGYEREAVDETIGRAARAIDRLRTELRAGAEEIARLQAAQAGLESELEITSQRSPAELVGDPLLAAHRAAESLIEDARRASAREQEAAREESREMLTRARGLLDEATGAHRDVHNALADASSQAETLIRDAHVEARNIETRATESASRRQAQLEIENARLE